MPYCLTKCQKPLHISYFHFQTILPNAEIHEESELNLNKADGDSDYFDDDDEESIYSEEDYQQQSDSKAHIPEKTFKCSECEIVYSKFYSLTLKDFFF